MRDGMATAITPCVDGSRLPTIHRDLLIATGQRSDRLLRKRVEAPIWNGAMSIHQEERVATSRIGARVEARCPRG